MASKSGSRPKVPLKAWLHLGMGVVYLLMSGLVIYAKHFGTISLSEGTAYAMGTLLALYGVFRLYRGIADIRQAGEQE